MTPHSGSASRGYSPPIKIVLEIGSERFPVAELAPSYLVLRSARALGATRATVVMTVDGKPTRYPVILPNGINPTLERQPLVDLNASPLAEAI